MDIKQLQATVINALEDVKAQEIRVFDTVHLTSLFDRIAIASGTSNRQTKALAASVRDKVKESGGDIVSIEGEDTGEWVLVDLGDMIVHIMQPAIRAYYRLEEIWGEKEVKLDAARRASARTSARTSRRAAAADEQADGAPKKPGRHLAASRAADDEAPKKTAARKTAAKTSGAGKSAAKSAAKTPAAKKAVGKKIKVPASKSAAAAKKSASKTAAKRAPARARTA
jgi:ribosome-associated protein